jgi:SulP family sulfate permease
LYRAIANRFPLLNVGKSYSTDAFKGDFYAGITVAVLLIPQAMAYAILAGLPPVYGLYAGCFPTLIYALMGTSPKLAVGPVALDSLLIATGLNALSISEPENYISSALFLAFYVGVLQILLGGLKLGFLIHYLSKPVLSGFISAAALVIMAGQLTAVFGVSVPETNVLEGFLENASLSFLHLPTFFVGIGGLFFLLFFKRLAPNFPASLALVFILTVFSCVFMWESNGIAVVGSISKGLPSFELPQVSLSRWYAMTPLAITLALISFMQSYSITKRVEEKEGLSFQRPDQELFALGVANLLGSFFRAFPVSGGLTRTAVNHESGAKTAVSGLITALVVGIVLLFFTEYFYHLPLAALGSIILVAVLQLIDFTYPSMLWHKHRPEFYIFCFTFLATLILGVKYGILLGVFASLAHMVYRHSKPHIAVLGRVKGTVHFKNTSRFSGDVITFSGVLILRFDSSLFYGNQCFFREQVQRLMDAQKTPVKFLIIDAAPIHYIDATAFEMLHRWIFDLHSQGKGVLWAQVIGPIRDGFYKHRLINTNQEQTFFSSLDSAVSYLSGISPSTQEEKISNQVNY